MLTVNDPEISIDVTYMEQNKRHDNVKHES